MRSKLTLAGVAAVMMCALLPMKSGGCGGKTACIAVTADEYAKKGACPSAADMGKFFQSDSCGFGTDVSSVDGEGTYDGALCCYPVTKVDDDASFAEECFGGFGTGGAGGFGGTGGGCTSCANAIAEPGVPFSELCFTTQETTYNDLKLCGCTACAECELNLCKDLGPTIDCLGCLESACTNAFNICANEF